MAVLCLLTNTPWPWPTPAEAASARGGFPTLETEWRGRSEAEVCTSEARKIRVPLARARGGASQEGLVSLLRAERRDCFSVSFTEIKPALVVEDTKGVRTEKVHRPLRRSDRPHLLHSAIQPTATSRVRHLDCASNFRTTSGKLLRKSRVLTRSTDRRRNDRRIDRS
jgi:hypothetical protein